MRCHEMKKQGGIFILWPEFSEISAKQRHKMKNTKHIFISWPVGTSCDAAPAFFSVADYV